MIARRLSAWVTWPSDCSKTKPTRGASVGSRSALTAAARRASLASIVLSAPRSRSVHSPSGVARSTASGTSPTSSVRSIEAPAARRCWRTRARASRGPVTSGSTRFIDTWVAAPTCRPSARIVGTPDGRRHLLRHREVWARHPDVEGDQRVACTDGRGPCGGVRGRGARVGGEVAKRVSAHVGQRPLRAVDEAGHLVLGRQPGGERVASGDRVGPRACRRGGRTERRRPPPIADGRPRGPGCPGARRPSWPGLEGPRCRRG